jgi:lipoprotein-anchoring transpeptidase ErfK/SrfK
MFARKWMIGLALAAGLGACSPDQGTTPAKPAGPAAVTANPAQTAQVKTINEAQFVPPPPTATASPPPPSQGSAPKSAPQPDPALIKAEILLARAGASPGSVDGLAGSNLKRAIAAYERMNGLTGDGTLTPDIWSRLTSAPGQAPVAAVYILTAQDVAGPYYPDVGENMVAAAKLPAVGYARPTEMLAERFHMSEALLQSLNPGADYRRAGTALTVVQPMVPAVPAVDHIEVDKAAASVRAYDETGRLIASFPATVGSTERPSPSGVHKVVGVSFNPVYTYDPSKLTWGPKSHGKFIIHPGPNNPVGLVWIDLNAPGYGIHGSPGPDQIGKTASHGCVRLTNWDAVALGHAVKPGVMVTFVRQRGGKAKT